ncbi:amidohydrolase family protein [Agromyces ramosus]|uniref:L-fuconolactonase n=1 Tax=Agromyces ramosus TaxID=33879 RepID=A0ABU0RC37_9MICO|nr:amidohydrolase family protein [Agromyces ramosus]MDQ0895640.1 L-fuconolactonase [Agromyces ramosus]
MHVVDSHTHIWDPRRFDYPWLNGLEPLDRPMLPTDIDRAGGRVSAMVFVQADCDSRSALDEARWVDGLDWPELAGIVAGVDLRDRVGLAAHLDALTQMRRVVGVRHLLQGEPDDFFRSPALRDGLVALAERRLTFDACVRHEQLPLLASLLEQSPSLRVVVDHLGKPPVDEGIDGESGRRWASAIDDLAALDSVSIKVSGLAPEARDAASLDRNAAAFIRHAVEAFGADRSMVGSDWPVSAKLGAAGTFGEWIDRVHAATNPSTTEREAVDAATATSFYGLPGTAP